MTNDFTIDDFLGGKIKLKQLVNGYRATSDAVLLAAAIKAKKNQKILDIGTGTGAVSLCLLARCPDLSVTGLELQTEMFELAQQNACLNNLQDKFTLVQGDIRTRHIENLPTGSFDWVITNPPFITEDQISPLKVKDIAHRQSECTLKEWVENALRYTTANGYFAMINKADRLPEILSLLYPKLGEIRIFPIFTKADTPAKRVIVIGRKSSKSPAVIEKGLTLMTPDLKKTDKAEQIMRFAKPLF